MTPLSTPRPSTRLPLRAARSPIARVALLAVLVAAACSRTDGAGRADSVPPDLGGATGREAANAVEDMPGMVGMPGMGAAAGAPDTSGVPLDRVSANRLGITFARAAQRPLGQGARVAGTLAYAEPRRAIVSARVDGWVELLHVGSTGRSVRRGEPLLALHSPTLVSAQEEYLAARRLGDSALTDAARRRLALWNVPDALILRLERTGTPERTVQVVAPIAGEVTEKMVVAGQAVRAGDALYLLADRRELWVNLVVFETDARLLRVGTPVALTVDAFPGERYRGRVELVEPQLDSVSRTLTARVAVSNADGRLRPGMFASARIASSAAPRLVVPLTAVLPTGTRDLVFVNRGDGRFVPREVAVGVRGDSLVEIVRGLQPGDEVVASATYLLDSESNLAAAMQGLMLQMGMGLDMGGMPMGGGSDPAAGMQTMPGMPMPPRTAPPPPDTGATHGRPR